MRLYLYLGRVWWGNLELPQFWIWVEWHKRLVLTSSWPAFHLIDALLNWELLDSCSLLRLYLYLGRVWWGNLELPQFWIWVEWHKRLVLTSSWPAFHLIDALLNWELLDSCSLLWLCLYSCRVWWGNLELPQFWIWVEWHKRLVLTSSWPAFHLIDALLNWELLDSCSLLWLCLYSCRVWWGNLELPQFWIWVEWHKRLVLTSSWPAFHLIDALLNWELLDSCSLLWLCLYSCRVWWGNLELPQFWIWVEWHKRLVLTSSWPAFHLIDALLNWELLDSCSLLWLCLYSCRVWWGNLELPQFWIWVEWHKRLVLTSSWPAFHLIDALLNWELLDSCSLLWLCLYSCRVWWGNLELPQFWIWVEWHKRLVLTSSWPAFHLLDALLNWELLDSCSLLWLCLYSCRVWWGNLELLQFWIWVEWHKRLVLTSSWPAFHLIDALLNWELLDSCSLLWLCLYSCRVWWGNLELPQFWIWVEWHKRLVLTSSWAAFHLLDALLNWELLDSCSLLWLCLYSCRVWWGNLELPQFWIWVEWHKRLVLTSSWPAFHLLDALLNWELLDSCSLLWLCLYSCRVWWGNLELL